MLKKLLLGLTITLLLFTAIFLFIPQTQMISLAIYHNYIKSSTEFTVDGEILYMNGYICGLTPNQLKKVITNNPQIKTIEMLEVTGSLDDEANFPMAAWVREKGLNTHLNKNSDIESGGTDFFLSGVTRTMDAGAKIGVHSWAEAGTNIEGKDLPKDHPDHEMNRKYIEDMLGNDSFYWYTLYAAPADGMHFMTDEEILKYNMITEPILQSK